MKFPQGREKFNRKGKIGILIFLLTVIIYANSLVNSFVWDDRYLIAENSLIKNWRNLPKFFTTQLYQGSGKNSNFYRPIQKLSISLDYSLWRLKPFGYHLTNIIIHAFNAVLVYVFLTLLFKRREISLISAVFFAVHPIHTQAVTYIAGRADLLAGLFIFSSLISFVRYRRHNDARKYYWIALLCFIFALLSRESAIILPFVLFLYDISFDNQKLKKTKTWLNDYLPLLLLLSVYIILRLTVLNFSSSGIWGNGTDFYLRMVIFAKIIFMYIRLLFLPFGLHMDYMPTFSQPHILISNILLLLTIPVVVRSYKYSRRLFFASTWFFLTLLPVSNIVPLNEVMAEHWLYIPSIGFFIIFSLGMVKLSDSLKTPHLRNSFLIFALIPILSFYSALTIKRNMDWKDEFTIYKNTLKYSPNSARVHNNLGIVYANIENYEEAIEHFEEAIRLKPKYFEAYNNLGTIYQIQKQYEQAIRQYEKAIELNPDYPAAYNNLGGTYMLLGKYEEAVKECEKALLLRGDYAEAYTNLGNVCNYMGKFEQAVAHYKKATESNPDYLEAYINLGVVYNDRGEYLEALKTLKDAIKLKPSHAELHNNLGIVYQNLRDYEKALHEYTTALVLDPEYAQACNNAGVVYSIVGKHEDAARHYKKAIEIDENFSLAYANLGIMYIDTENYKLAEEYLKQAEKLGLPVQEYLGKLEKISK